MSSAIFSMFRAQQRPPGFIGNFTIFSLRYDRRDLWDKEIKTRVFCISLAGKIQWKSEWHLC